MGKDFLSQLEAAIAAARRHSRPVARTRCVPRPRQELTDALERCRSILATYDASLQDVRVTTLHEYATARLLRDTIPAPLDIASDLQRHLRDRPAWWEECRDTLQP